MSDLKSVRKDYDSDQLLESKINRNPYHLFEQWLKEAEEVEPTDYNAMTIATMDGNGFPNLRTVLLRGFNRDGISFFTNYNSDKGKEIAADNKVGINFFWKDLERQIRIKGVADKLPETVSDTYFAGRPRESQIGAWVKRTKQHHPK